ncbi:MAG: rRNA pseudouridine synthase [bacterium]|nr:rRNA pseudouridine synthase [bacterium]
METIRINKYISEAGVYSRREADRLIEDGKVKINDTIAKLGDRVSHEDRVTVNDDLISAHEEKIYIAFHKPFGVITTSDKQSDNTVMDYIELPTRVYPIGRLDVQSSGLLLLTNDGAIVNTVLKSEHKKEKEYIVTLNKPIQPKDVEQLANGVILNDQKTLPAKVRTIAPNKINIILIQGLNRQIRRMCEALGYGVAGLQRIRIGTIQLDDLASGKWRTLTEKEIEELKK